MSEFDDAGSELSKAFREFGDRFIRAKNKQTVVILAWIAFMAILFPAIVGATIAAAHYFHW